MSGIRQNQIDPDFQHGLLEPIYVTGATHTAAINTKVYLDNATPCLVTLPTTFKRGNVIEIIGIQGWELEPGTGTEILDADQVIDDTEKLTSDFDTSCLKLEAISDTQWTVAAFRNQSLGSGFVPTQAIVMGGEDSGPTALSSTETQSFTSPFTVAAGGNSLTNVRYMHTVSDTTVGNSYCNGGFSTGATEVNTILKMLNSDQSNSTVGGQTLASVKSHMGRGRNEANSRGHLVGGKTSLTEQNIAERQEWDDTVTSLGAVLTQTTGEMGACYRGSHTYLAGGSRNGTFRTTTITRWDNDNEAYTTLGAVLTTTNVRQDGAQDLVNFNGIFVGGDNTTIQKIDMTVGSESISTPSVLTETKEGPSAGSSLTDGWIQGGGSPAKTAINRYEWVGDAVSSPVSLITGRREVDAATA